MRSQKELAERIREALRQNPFLVELGQRAHCSQNKAGRAAQMLGLTDEEVKIVADVIRLKERNPDAFQKILESATKEERQMKRKTAPEKTDAEEVWIDEHGKRVLIQSFCRAAFWDLELENTLNSRTDRYSPTSVYFERGLRLGKAEDESFVETFMILCRIWNRLAGFPKEDLIRLSDGPWTVDGLIQWGYFREKWVKGTLVIFPTEKLLKAIMGENHEDGSDEAG
ncbi:MAG: hypothetical protein A2806_04595 [Candidatus Terrybacteria bacterium RIFCSPHIGHO2_01_FULL_48_17]|uniref:Uncharacterized protein n=1 Tax=Candidatus Terrybacteria bacterium RIFCSPHIGHO2_01_FULL_48_17 TaxID=1802362 RepID=A0A1G2PMW8_9BACT|nr:MAG: hypothetical protein A2806_04595 [Candidatus Terrybacteria bacterium RIFCSPHIGHO2_01_FULL_48_17]OHA52826.1 MAG: hypothetical protein A3A30_02930 [Candidatus Terrybacteria bacterium RIFCSPLOWO2_01_FULL_48_14]